MTKLYFMHREFPGRSFEVRTMLEEREFCGMLAFDDSWYFLEYCFFGRDRVCSEVSSAVRTHLYNLAATLYRHFEDLTGEDEAKRERIPAVIGELTDIAEYSREFPICLLTYGDNTSREFLDEWLAPMPSAEQIAHLLKLPHMTRHESERVPYRHDAEKVALKRYRNELASHNRRQKLAAKNEQRSNANA